jgi:hypothetical protein
VNDRPSDRPVDGLLIEIERRNLPRAGVSLDQLKRELAAKYNVTVSAVHAERGKDRLAFFVAGREVYSVAL